MRGLSWATLSRESFGTPPGQPVDVKTGQAIRTWAEAIRRHNEEVRLLHEEKDALQRRVDWLERVVEDDPWLQAGYMR